MLITIRITDEWVTSVGDFAMETSKLEFNPYIKVHGKDNVPFVPKRNTSFNVCRHEAPSKGSGNRIINILAFNKHWASEDAYKFRTTKELYSRRTYTI